MSKSIQLLTCFLILAASQLLAQEVEIELPDGYKLNATLSLADKESPSVLLLHQCNRSQEMWEGMVAELNANGFSTLTVDMKGYGKSASASYDIEKHEYDYVTGSFKNDIEAVNDYWVKATPEAKYRIVIGASCGGGLACKTAVINDEVKAMILLSPSLREHWVDQEYLNKLSNKRDFPILGIAAEEDTNAVRYVEQVFETSKSDYSKVVLYKTRKHGEPLFSHDPSLISDTVEWIVQLGLE